MRFQQLIFILLLVILQLLTMRYLQAEAKENAVNLAQKKQKKQKTQSIEKSKKSQVSKVSKKRSLNQSALAPKNANSNSKNKIKNKSAQNLKNSPLQTTKTRSTSSATSAPPLPPLPPLPTQSGSSFLSLDKGVTPQPTPLDQMINPQTIYQKYEYKPLDREFWKEVNLALKDNNYKHVLTIADYQIKSKGIENLEGNEGLLAISKGLNGLGFSYAATQILTDIIKNMTGTFLAKQALFELEDLVKKFPVDEDETIDELLVDIEHASDPKELQDFINYHTGIYNLVHGYDNWSQDIFKKINPDSFWGLKLKFNEAVNLLEKDKLEPSLELFSSLMNNPQTPPEIKKDSTHNYARLIFEKGNFTEAYKMFKNIELSPRERGWILLERAWAKYYNKDYAKALGLLMAYEAPLFDPARLGEAYILRMMIYKELCYYDTALSVVKEFNKRYSKTIETIRKRRDLRKDKILVNLAALDRRLQERVNFLNNIKEERNRLRSGEHDEFSFWKKFNSKYDIKINETYERLDWDLMEKTREMANLVLDWQEQISFLDYQTRIDSLRVSRPIDENEYQPEEISFMTFDKIYWIFQGEYWLDELEKLKVNVESQCFKPAQEGELK